IRSRLAGISEPEGCTRTIRGNECSPVDGSAIDRPACEQLSAVARMTAPMLRCRRMSSIRGLDLIREALVFQHHVLPGLDVGQLERVALEAIFRKGVFGDEVGQAETQILVDRDELQRVLLQPSPHDDEGSLIEVVEAQRAREWRGYHLETGDLPEG